MAKPAGCGCRTAGIRRLRLPAAPQDRIADSRDKSRGCWTASVPPGTTRAHWPERANRGLLRRWRLWWWILTRSLLLPVVASSSASTHEEDLFELGQHFYAVLGNQHGFAATNGKLSSFAQRRDDVKHHARVQDGGVVALERDNLRFHPGRRKADADRIAGPFAGSQSVGAIDIADRPLDVAGQAHV